MMAEIEAEWLDKLLLAIFQAKLAADKAAADASTAAYQASLLDAEFAALEAQLKAEADAAEMMAAIEAEMARQAALCNLPTCKTRCKDKAAAYASTAAYQDSLKNAELASA